MGTLASYRFEVAVFDPLMTFSHASYAVTRFSSFYFMSFIVVMLNPAVSGSDQQTENL